MDASSIIDQKYLPTIQQALNDLDTADRELELAQRAGLMSGPYGAKLQALLKQVQDARAQLTAIKQVYFPGQ